MLFWKTKLNFLAGIENKTHLKDPFEKSNILHFTFRPLRNRAV